MSSISDISGRISKLIEHLNVGPSDFMSRVHVSRQTYHNLKTGKSRPDYKTIHEILIGFPEVSAEWLMRGVGSIMKGDEPSKEEYEMLKKQSEVFEEKYFELKKQLGKPKATTRSLLIDRDVPENRMLAPKHISVFCQEIIDRLIATYGFYRFPSVN